MYLGAFTRLSTFLSSRSTARLPQLFRPGCSAFSTATMTDTTARLAKLRSLMQERNVQIYVVPSEDSHNSEYIAACDARRAFISGFTGSAGCAIVTDEVAAVSTDGRYFNQASKELDDNWTLLKQGMQDVPTWQEWAAEQSAGGKNVAVDPTLLPGPAAKKLQEQIRKAGGAELRPLDENLADIVWGSERPARSLEPVSVLPDKLAGKTVEAKLTELRQEMEKKNCPGFFVSMLDEIAWLFNLRGKDIPYNPVFFSYASVTPDSATLYIDQRKVDQDSLAHLTANNVRVKPYDEFFKDAEQLHAEVSAKNQEAKDGKNAKFLTSKTASWALNKALGGEDMVDEIRSPIADAKTVKNEVEMEGMRACHIRDAVALIEYFAWLEDQLLTQKATVDEAQGADKLEELRSTRENFVGLSFNTISSTGANAAIIHYGPEHGNCSSIDPAAPYLCDSGGQYLDGTTDTTRTMHFGTPNAAEIEAYTLVLKGLIALHMIVFPKGTNGYAIDCLARQHLWKNGLDFRHGTGHGVGSYLNVHEGPIGIGTRLPYTEVALAPGNVLSNEPGFYEDGKYGVRIENMMMVVEVKPKHTWGDKPFYGFENVTMVPYCRKLIDTTMLSKEEKGWLNASNVEILEKIKGHLENNALATAWLERETQPYE